MSYQGPLQAVAAYARRLMVDAAVWRKESVTDAGGGLRVDWVDQQRTIPVQLDAPSDNEMQVAAQSGVTITHAAVMPLGADVEHGDRLLIEGASYQLQSGPLTATHSAVARATIRKTPFEESTE